MMKPNPIGVRHRRVTEMSDGRAAFLEMVAVERGSAANTLDAYRRDLDDFADFSCGYSYFGAKS